MGEMSFSGGWEGSANFKATFSSGGAIEFSEQLQRAVGEGISLFIFTFK